MALSNWDTLAFSIDGPCDGFVTNHVDATIEIYKNWLYLRTDEGEKCEARVDQGVLEWRHWSIDARRGPQNGVFVVAHSSRYLTDVEVDDLAADRRADKQILVGCGVYGYEEPTEKWAQQIRDAGYDPDSEDNLIYTVTSYSGESDTRLELLPIEHGSDSAPVIVATGLPDIGWVGVNEASLQFLRSMVAEHSVDSRWEKRSRYWPGDELAKIDWDEALRVNQGDLYLAGLEAPATSVGDSEDPLLSQALRPPVASASDEKTEA